MSKLCLGTAQIGMQYGIANHPNDFSGSEINEILKKLKSENINTIDTAISYGDSEMRLGREDLTYFNIISKLPAIPESENNIEEWVNKNVESSLNNLHISKLHGILLHNPNDLLNGNSKKLFKALVNLKDNNIVEKIGISGYSLSELDELLRNFRFDIVQYPFNILDRRLESSGWMKTLYEEDVEIHVRSIFLQGLLLMPFNDVPKKFYKWNRVFKLWESAISNLNLSKIEACLKFACSFKEITKVIVGVDTKEQLHEILDIDLSNEQISLPNLGVEDEKLLNPSLWKNL